MINVREASVSVLSNLYKPQVASVSIQEAVGRVLAESVHADRDLPPFHRVSMDGIAIKFESWKQGRRTFRIESTQAAGEPQKILQGTDNAIEVMTGAMLPIGTDTVIRYEDLQTAAPYVTILVEQLEAWQSIHRQGQDARKDEPLLPSAMVLSPAEIALLATIGKQSVKVFTSPKTALVANGDELVEIGATPLPHQIRRSNTHALEAAMRTMHWPGEQFHLQDEKESLKRSMEIILEEHDVIILSGGVSQGKFDFIPVVLEELGVKKIFHQVSQRPGKPFWFGVNAGGKTVFALPGNPVSTFMCFYRYIKPWFQKSLGVEENPMSAILAKDFSFAPRLTYFLQVMVRNENGKLMAYPDAGGGSGDFANLKKIDGFLELPAEQSDFKAGDVFPFIAFRL
jgi:molybdopterin molybdotransferase